jgi:hypothetical protein
MPDPLGTFSLEMSEGGINKILEVLAIEHRVEIRPLGIDARILGSISVGGSVAVRDFRIRINGETATGSAQAAPAFTVKLDLPGRGPVEVPLDASFRIPEVISVTLEHTGSKAQIVLSNLDLSMDLRCPPLVPQRVWDLLLGQLGRLKARIVQAIETELRRRPIELFDLKDHSGFELPDGKNLETKLSFETLEFKGGALRCSINVADASC